MPPQSILHLDIVEEADCARVLDRLLSLPEDERNQKIDNLPHEWVDRVLLAAEARQPTARDRLRTALLSIDRAHQRRTQIEVIDLGEDDEDDDLEIAQNQDSARNEDEISAQVKDENPEGDDEEEEENLEDDENEDGQEEQDDQNDEQSQHHMDVNNDEDLENQVLDEERSNGVENYERPLTPIKHEFVTPYELITLFETTEYHEGQLPKGTDRNYTKDTQAWQCSLRRHIYGRYLIAGTKTTCSGCGKSKKDAVKLFPFRILPSVASEYLVDMRIKLAWKPGRLSITKLAEQRAARDRRHQRHHASATELYHQLIAAGLSETLALRHAMVPMRWSKPFKRTKAFNNWLAALPDSDDE